MDSDKEKLRQQMISVEQLKPLRDLFRQEYFKSPYEEYMTGAVGISWLGSFLKESDLGVGESLDDLCLYVHLLVEPPEDLNFPTEYEGARVIYAVVEIPIKAEVDPFIL